MSYHPNPWARGRRRAAWGILFTLALIGVWLLTPGLPVLIGPRANAGTQLAGQILFEHAWTPGDPLAGGDGLGPVFNERSCVACHFQGGVGGGGPNDVNVMAYHVLPTQDDPNLRSGVIHAFAVAPSFEETVEQLQRLFPKVDGGTRVVNGCTVRAPEFDPVRTESINTTALFGAGWIDRISTKTVKLKGRQRLWANVAAGFQPDNNVVPAGRPRILSGGRVGKFGWKGQFATLKEFVAAACANELGLGNPLLDEPSPLPSPHHEPPGTDLNRKQFRSLVAFVDTLPRPTEVIPADSMSAEQARRGKALFQAVGCAICHTPDLGGVEGVYSDFLLHRIENPAMNADYAPLPPPDVELPRGQPKLDEWKTPPLWGVADSAPYFHDGRSATLQGAILRHRGDASIVTDAFLDLPTEDQAAVIGFLKTLKAPKTAAPAEDPLSVQLASS